jgi:hypothetical protein
MPKYLSILLGIFCFSLGNAQISINNSSFTYTEDFDGLANSGTTNVWTNNSTVTGWYSSQNQYRASTGSDNTGALYSFGSAGNGERAIGSQCSNGTGTIFNGVRFINNTGSVITRITVEYYGEQWRNGGNTAVQDLTFSYQKAATSLTMGTWTTVPQLNFSSPVTGSTAAALNGNDPNNRTFLQHTIIVNVAIGEEIWFRWQDLNDTGNDHGLAVDDFTISSIILPVTFEKVSAQRNDNKTDIFFSTASEVNNDFFTIERSSEGMDFEVVGRLQGAGNATSTQKYYFEDRDVPSGVLYYRIKQTDFDGRFDYSNVVKVNGIANKIDVFSRRTGGQIVVRTAIDNYDLEVFSISGIRLFYQQNLSLDAEISLQNVPSGMCIVRLVAPQGVVSKQIML